MNMLEKLLTPQTVAVVGASKSKDKVGYEIVANLVSANFEGVIVPVNPSAKEICGLQCYPNISACKQKIDLSVIVVPRDAVLPSVKESINNGAKAIVVITAGFKEVDAEGEALEAEIARVCSEKNVRLLGPNCLGVINTYKNLNASFASQMPGRGNISVVSQSGALCTAILDWAASRKVGLAKLVSIGNKADLSETDFLDALRDDEETKVIVGYLESIDDGKAFMNSAKAASEKKPIVIFKSGTTQAGSKAASSHTGSLAGADMAYGAAFMRSGVIRADTFESMLDYAIGFATQPLPKGDRVAIITNAGGPGIMAADAVEHSGMKVWQLEQNNAAALRDKLPKAASVSNPIDVLGDAGPDRYVDAVNAAQNDADIDSIIVILTPQAMTKPVETARAIAQCVNGQKPVLVSYMGGTDVQAGRDVLMSHNIPDYPAPERAVNALKAMYDYGSWRKRPQRVLTRFPVNRKRAKRILRRYEKTNQVQLTEAAAKGILKAYNFSVPDGMLASSAEDAVEIARQVGFPVAMKISSPEIIHKSDIGGVKLNLSNDENVRDAYDLMMLRTQQRMPNAPIDGVYVEQMCSKGKEVILGMTRDPQFGPMLMFGLGGIFVEVMKDVAFNIAPITHDEALQMLKSTKSFSLLQGVRGQSAVDMSTIASSLQRISQLVTDFPQIIEMDINPFIVGRAGTQAIAADARITLANTEVHND
jgi:acetate---CoA ligase (ADP-forming)